MRVISSIIEVNNCKFFNKLNLGHIKYDKFLSSKIEEIKKVAKNEFLKKVQKCINFISSIIEEIGVNHYLLANSESISSKIEEIRLSCVY